MKKLVFGEQSIQVTDATCDFCQEYNYTCFETTTGSDDLRDVELGYLVKSRDWKYESVGGFWSSDIKAVFDVDKAKLGWWTKDISEGPKRHVCINCVKQMAKYKEVK